MEGKTSWWWRRGTFTVPASIPHDRVSQSFHLYIRKFGNHLVEKEGLEVLEVTGPVVDLGRMGDVEITPSDRRRYVLWARVTRSSPPPQVTMTVPDEWVSAFERLGWEQTG